MTNRQRFAQLQALVKSLVDELSTPKPPTPEPPAPLPAEPVPEPPPVRKHLASVEHGLLSDRWCCPEHERKFQRQELRHGLIPVDSILDLQNALQIAPPR